MERNKITREELKEEIAACLKEYFVARIFKEENIVIEFLNDQKFILRIENKNT